MRYGLVKHPGVRLRALIEKTRPSQRDWAEAIGCSEKHLSRILTGDAMFGPAFAVRFEELTGESAMTLMGMKAAYEIDQIKLRREEKRREQAEEGDPLVERDGDGVRPFRRTDSRPPRPIRLSARRGPTAFG